MSSRALIVGISTYLNPKNNLKGVENDVSAMVSVFSKFGISDLEIIRDTTATSSNIRSALQNLVSGAKSGDTRIFYYSGHGALLPPGFSGTDDVDGQDEALVPFEGNVTSLIMDNWMSAFLKNIVPSDIKLWSIYDSCHSGDMYKDAVIDGISTIPLGATEKIVRFEDLNFDGPPMRISSYPSATTKSLILDGSLNNSIHFGAAEPEKTALVLDIAGTRRSAFTWALEKVAIPGMTVAEFEIAVAAKQKEVTVHHRPQVAANAADKARRIFE
jgi:hypothetical protein